MEGRLPNNFRIVGYSEVTAQKLAGRVNFQPVSP